MEMNNVLAEYREWILNHKDPAYELIETNDAHDTILARTDYAEASVSFHQLPQLLVELKIIENKKEEESFYLHFEFKELQHAKELFEEMLDSLKEMKDRQKMKITICCSSALTSSFFAQKLNNTAERLGLTWEFNAVSYDRLYETSFRSDVILLAPQIGYLLDRTSEIMKNSVVMKIPAKIFGSYDVEGMLWFIEDAVAEKRRKETKKEEMPVSVMMYGHRILVIIVISEFTGKQIIYRVYSNGQVESEDRFRKINYSVRDLEDVIDVVLTRTSIEAVCICTPGVIKDGRMTFHESHIIDQEVVRTFTQKYGMPVFFCNDANAMALGFYALQTKYRSIVFYFHPHASRICGTGTIINGQLNTGHANIAGEMQFLVRKLNWSEEPAVLARTPEGSLELVTGYLTAMISCIDPEAVVIYCDMVPDMGELKTSIGQYIRMDAIPMLIKVEDVTEYMFAGGVAYIINEVKGRK